MAQDSQNTSSEESKTFDKSLNTDINDFHLPKNEWSRGRIVINNSITGDLGKLGNEPANLSCVSAPYPIIGFIHIIEDKWAVYSTDNINSEIGLFIESNCGTMLPANQYIVNDKCLKFNQDNLIKGVSRSTSDCTYKLYWDDGINPSRNLDIDVTRPDNNYPFLPLPAPPNTTNINTPVPYIQTCVDSNGSLPGGCIICSNTPALDCNKLRLALFINPICSRVEKGVPGGNLLNGSYFVVMAYAVKSQKISDWYVSNIQGLFEHNNSATSLDVFIDSIDPRYDEVIIGVGKVVNAQTVVRQAGIYSTRQTRFSFDTIFDTWPSIPIEQLPIMTPIMDKSDAMYNVGDYLIRVGPTSKEDFNYQPLANQIVAKWQSVQYPADYYHKGNNLTGYMRDEVYSFFIQYEYDTGDKSNEYHIPGRPARQGTLFTTPAYPTSVPAFPITSGELMLLAPTGNTFTPGPFWETYNTAILGTSFPVGTNLAPDGIGSIIQEGYMGYWESSEFYPDKTPQIWNANDPSHPWTAVTSVPYPGTLPSGYDLCGTPIRHHKFPEDTLGSNLALNSPGGANIRIMGVKFENIKAPRDNNGNLIPGIIGYRILRGSRNGNKTIIAKGIINNMHRYDIPGSGGKQGLYPNYPYNDLRNDPFLLNVPSKTASCITTPGGIENANTNTNLTPFSYTPGAAGDYMQYNDFKQDYFTFHSPDTNFNNPFLAAKEFRIYGNASGKVVGKFDLSEKHPQEKLISDFVFLLSSIAGIGYAVLQLNGERSTSKKRPKYQGMSFEEVYFTKNTYDLTDKVDLKGTTTVGPITYAGTAPYLMSSTTTAGTNNFSGSNTGSTTGTTTLDTPLPTGTRASPANTDLPTLFTTLNLGYADYTPYNLSMVNFLPLTQAITGLQATDSTLSTTQTTAQATTQVNPAISGTEENIDQKDGAQNRTPTLLNVFQAIPTFMNYFSQGTDSFMRLIRAMLKYRDFAVRYHSHGFYDNLTGRNPATFRTELVDQQYINPEILQLNNTYKVNNLYRQRSVVLQTTRLIPDPIVVDRTRYTASELSPVPQSIQELCNFTVTDGTTIDGASGQTCSSWYGALKVRIDNQYGQLNNIVSIPVSPCFIPITFAAGTFFPAGGIVPGKGDSTTVLFGGDVYVNRYTEKNTFLFFYDWLYGQPNGTQFNYKQHQMLPYPKYWADFSEFQTNDFTASVFSWITTPIAGNPSSLVLPSAYYVLDGNTCTNNIAMTILTSFQFDAKGWFYLFNSGVRDFFVESEINVAYRDYGEPQDQRFYDPYSGGDSKDLFATNIIKSGNYYKYDKSLSISQLFINYASWASMQSPAYNPYVAETCFVYRPKRLIYSLPAQFEGLKDGWKVFLPNNYFDFLNIVTCIKPVNKSGAMIFFDAASPVQFQGTDQLETGLGTKLTIGDGGLFSQPMQSVINVDSSHEYASCQNRLSVINTPAGLFWISQNQGKIFNLSSGLKEVSNLNLKWWFAQYLPYRLTKDFPDFELKDNPVTGIGCQSMYDNLNGLIYFSKVDYKLRDDITETLKYLGSNRFKVVETGLEFGLGDVNSPLFFNDASWTISYDPKTEGWLGWHDWHPTLNMPGKNTFMTVNPFDKKSIWIHNVRCDLYCNYYGINYPFEVEFIVNAGQNVNTLRSIQYIMEAYKYAENCYDRFHVLNYNFDEAVIFNTEQVSGLLKLNLSPKNNPEAILTYPVIQPTTIQILFSKEENKYRFNQFWDVTDDRGEFFNPSIPGFAQRPIWDTGDNGYIRVLNPINLNYAKPPFQRKKFRHYTTSVLLRKKISGDRKMLVMITNIKNLYSPR